MDIIGLRQAVRTGTVMLGESTAEISFDILPSANDGPVGVYIHSHCSYEVHAAVSGDHTLVIGGVRTILREGEGMILPPGTLHQCIADGPGRVGFCYRFSGSASGHPSALIKPLLFSDGVRRFQLDGLPELLRRIREEYLYGKPGYQEMAKHLLVCLMLSLSRAVSGDAVRTEPGWEPRMDRVGVIDRFFTMGCNRNPRKADLAELLSISERQVERVVKELYGMTFRGKVLQARLHTADYLLCQYAYPVSRVAELVGYGNAGSFCSAYKRYFGTTPSERLGRVESAPIGQDDENRQ